MQKGVEEPRSGGNCGLLKLTKFRGQDYGKSKTNQTEEVEKYDFPSSVTTLK
jgi:hypothetical protein